MKTSMPPVFALGVRERVRLVTSGQAVRRVGNAGVGAARGCWCRKPQIQWLHVKGGSIRYCAVCSPQVEATRVAREFAARAAHAVDEMFAEKEQKVRA